jgi:hypothetical protein
MADYFTRFSFEVALPSEAMAKAAVARMNALAEALMDGVEDEAAVPKALHGFFGECAGVHVEADRDRLWCRDDGGGPHLDLVVALVQQILTELHPTGSVAFEWSSDCSKHRLDAFGGGAVAVWSDDVKWDSTASMLERFAAERAAEKAEEAAEADENADLPVEG